MVMAIDALLSLRVFGVLERLLPEPGGLCYFCELVT